MLKASIHSEKMKMTTQRKKNKKKIDLADGENQQMRINLKG